MKKLITLTALLTLFTLPAIAADYTAITQDSEVTSVDQVKVQKAVTVQQKDVYDLGSLKARKADLEDRIAKLQTELGRVEAEITAITPIATGVKLAPVQIAPVEIVK